MPFYNGNAVGVGFAANINHMCITVIVEMGKFSHSYFLPSHRSAF
jgi:hypothetical protein